MQHRKHSMGEMNTASGWFTKLTCSKNHPFCLYALIVHISLRVRTLSVLTGVSSSSGMMWNLVLVLIFLQDFILTFRERGSLRTHWILQKCTERDITNEGRSTWLIFFYSWQCNGAYQCDTSVAAVGTCCSHCEWWVVNIIVEVSAFCGNIHVPWILSAFRGNIHVPWILSARILTRLATSPVLVTVHCLQHRTIHCSTVLPTISTRSPWRVFISLDALCSRGYWHLLMVHLTLRTHSHTLASYPQLRTCRWLLYILRVSQEFSICISYYLILRTFSIRKHVQQTFSSWTWQYFGTSLVLPDSQDFFNT